MDGLGYQTQRIDQGAPGPLHVTTTLPQVGLMLGLMVAEVPERMGEFLREAALFDQPFKRWEYVRGVHGIAGAGAEIVGILPESLKYTGFEGYWAGSGKSEEEVVTAEAEQGMLVMRHIAELTETTHAFAAGLDISRHPEVRGLVATALGKDYCLAHLDRLEPVFGELLARLRAMAETYPQTEHCAAFQARVAEATQAIGPSIYSDPEQQRLLIDLEREGKNILADGITERYDIPRASLLNRHINVVRLSEDELSTYRLLSEIGRMGHPVIRALLHIQTWMPSQRERGRT